MMSEVASSSVSAPDLSEKIRRGCSTAGSAIACGGWGSEASPPAERSQERGHLPADRLG